MQPPPDVVCSCNHWSEEHDSYGSCMAPGCRCQRFQRNAAANTPSAIADRGGEHPAGCACTLCRTP